MKKLILILLASLALFTYIRAFEKAEASGTSDVSIENSIETASVDIPIEISR